MPAPEHFDAVIVGSGFGGSVMAYRLAQAKLTVCLLERGKAYPPHSFPRSPFRMKGNFWDPSEGLHGLFDVWSFKHIGALVASGLGGGSLIYSNVLLRKDKTWFVTEDTKTGARENWPVSYQDLETHYESVEQILSPQRFPFDREPYASTFKTGAFHAAAKAKGLPCMLPPLAVTFGNDPNKPVCGVPINEAHPNRYGATRLTCTLCGECNLGCNNGAKNTLDHTYLSRAETLGAEIRERAEVRRFSPRRGGYDVYYVDHSEAVEGKKRDTRALPQLHLTCDKLILAAGSLGSTYLLLQNSEQFPLIHKDALGSRFSGNGDLLTLAWRSTQLQDGARIPRHIDPSRGPVITSAIRVGDELDGQGDAGRGFYVEDAAYPEFINWMLQLAESPRGIPRALKFAANWVALRLGLRDDSELSAEISELFGDCSPAVNSVPMLGMGRDIPNGKMGVDKASGTMTLSWELDLQHAYFKRMRKTMADLAHGMDAKFIDAFNMLLGRTMTVHPLGGCPMSDDPRRGVVDAGGQVHQYPGLYVADGSVMPGPVGANPSLTIAATADLFAERMLHGWTPP